MAKYLRYIGPFSPIRFLNLLPLSHMFGQAMATFVPPMLGGTVVFMRSLAPADIVRQISDAPHLGARVGAQDSRRAARTRPAHVSRDAGAAAASRLRPRAAAEGEVVSTLVAVPPRPSRLRIQVLERRGRRGAARPRARGVLGRARVPRRPGLRPHRDRAHRHPQSPVERAQGDGRKADSWRRREDRARTARSSSAATTSRRATSADPATRRGRSRTAGCIPATSAASTSRAGSPSSAARRR